MRGAKAVVPIAALVAAASVSAQTTSNCMNMGGGMVHCDNMGANGSTSSTNCTAMGSGMSNCTTMPMGKPQVAPPTPDMSRPQTNGTTLSFIGGLIARSQERSFRKKMTEMLTSGDCNGAANFAFAKERYDLSREIRRACALRAGAENPAAIPARSADVPASLESRLQLAAARANAATPMALDRITTVSKVEAIGTQILLTANVNGSGMAITEPMRSKVKNELCANQASPALLKAGASIRIKYFDEKMQEVGSVMVTQEDCGL